MGTNLLVVGSSILIQKRVRIPLVCTLTVYPGSERKKKTWEQGAPTFVYQGADMCEPNFGSGMQGFETKTPEHDHSSQRASSSEKKREKKTLTVTKGLITECPLPPFVCRVGTRDDPHHWKSAAQCRRVPRDSCLYSDAAGSRPYDIFFLCHDNVVPIGYLNINRPEWYVWPRLKIHWPPRSGSDAVS